MGGEYLSDNAGYAAKEPHMKPVTRLEDYLSHAPSKVRAALAATGLLVTLAAASIASPVNAADNGQLHPARTAPIVESSSTPLVSKLSTSGGETTLWAMHSTSIDDLGTINKLNARTSDMLRDTNEIATRLHESKAWSGTMFTPLQKAKNIIQAFVLSQMRADNSDVSKLDNFMVKLKADTPDNWAVNNVIADLNFKREILREATVELSMLVDAVKDDRPADIEEHREAMVKLFKEVGYAMDEKTDWSIALGEKLAPGR